LDDEEFPTMHNPDDTLLSKEEEQEKKNYAVVNITIKGLSEYLRKGISFSSPEIGI